MNPDIRSDTKVIQEKTARQLEALCQNLRELRQSYGLSLPDWSALTHIPLKVLEEAEQGNIVPGFAPEYILSLCSLTGLPPSGLLQSPLPSRLSLPDPEDSRP